MPHRHASSYILFLLLAGAMPALGQVPPVPAPGQPPAVPGATPFHAGAGGGVLVAPTRLVFDNRKRSAAVDLTNAGNVPSSYRISLVRMEMNENGGVAEVPAERVAGQPAVEDMIRFAPKLVTLNPQESQAVRIQLRKPADLPSGEYRVYMVFREMPPPAPEPVAGSGANEGKGISITLTSLFGVAIPVIIRNGETSAKVTVTGMALDPERKHLQFRLERTGNQSVYGDLKATFEPRSGKLQVISEANGLSVFTPNPFRNITMALEAPYQGARLGGGRIHLTFSAPGDQGGALMAESTLAVP